MTGAVPATKIRSPMRTARQKPTIGSYGEPDEMLTRSTSPVVSRAVRALEAIDRWPAPNAAVAVVGPHGILASRGPLERPARWASVTKLVTACAVLVAAEEGILDLDAPAGPPGSTVRHLLAHASGLPFEGDEPIARPGLRRIYSNSGYEMLATELEERAGIPFGAYAGAAVLEPCGIRGVELQGTAAAGLVGHVLDLGALASALFAPPFIASETLAEARSVTFPGLPGVIPGLGRYDPCDWGLGFELRNGKSPHWTGTRNSPQTFGHFGGSGSFLWLDPQAGAALVCLADLEFGDWALDAWPQLSDAVLGELP
jgi:CubicO group peptidase (beta-lactamase class C family)